MSMVENRKPLKIKSYVVLRERVIRGEVQAKAGDIVYECLKHDYGLANDDTYHFNARHISVTLNLDGDYPFFTIPLSDLLEKTDDQTA